MRVSPDYSGIGMCGHVPGAERGVGAGDTHLGFRRRRRRQSVLAHGALQDLSRRDLQTAIGGEIDTLDPGGFGRGDGHQGDDHRR